MLLDGPAASFGNTGLLADNVWPYDARAGNDGAVLLVLRRTRLHDALRGRRDLAAAVARGFLQTYGRRALAAFGKARDKGNGSPISPHGRSRAARADYAAPGGQSPGAAARRGGRRDEGAEPAAARVMCLGDSDLVRRGAQRLLAFHKGVVPYHTWRRMKKIFTAAPSASSRPSIVVVPPETRPRRTN